MRLPRKIRLDTVVVPVVLDEKHRKEKSGEFTFARYDRKKRRIQMYHGLPQTDDQDTLVHELLHACFDVAGIELPTDQEEYVVSYLSPWLAKALRDNPRLGKFLTKRF